MDKSREIKSRVIRIRLVDGTQINGQININRGSEGYDRVSDLIGDTKEEFLIVMNASAYYNPDMEKPAKHEVMFLNKRHILLAVPEADQR